MKDLNEIAQIFENNIGNRLTLELANGMIFAIRKLIEERPPEEKAKERPAEPQP